MKYVEAPESFDVQGRKLFLAGGITDCPDWQQEVRGMMEGTPWVLLNPRRADLPIGDPNAARAQITWEYHALRVADAILFWFPCETICPIVLYELGAWSVMGKQLFVGVHSDYQRRQDVEIQTQLACPHVRIVYNLDELVKQVLCTHENRKVLDCVQSSELFECLDCRERWWD